MLSEKKNDNRRTKYNQPPVNTAGSKSTNPQETNTHRNLDSPSPRAHNAVMSRASATPYVPERRAESDSIRLAAASSMPVYGCSWHVRPDPSLIPCSFRDTPSAASELAAAEVDAMVCWLVGCLSPFKQIAKMSGSKLESFRRPSKVEGYFSPFPFIPPYLALQLSGPDYSRIRSLLPISRKVRDDGGPSAVGGC